MIEAILQIFVSEQKAEAILSNGFIELIFMVLFFGFIGALIIHFLLFNKLKKLRNYLSETDRMDIEPLRDIKQQYEMKQQEESIKVETYVQEKFSSWRVFNVPVISLIKMVQMTVSVFILIGVLGTFIGLTMSLGSIDTGSEQLVENVASVLAGIDVAFYTSIAGMGCSLIMTVMVKAWNTELMLTDIMLKVESNLEEQEQNGLGRLINVSEMINDSILNLQKTNQKSLSGIENSFKGFQEYTTGLQQSAKDLAKFNEGLSSNLNDFQAIFERVNEITSGFDKATAKLNENFDHLFSYFKKMDQRNEHMVKMFEDTYQKMKEVSSAQLDTFNQFDHSVEDLKKFASSVADGQETIKHAFERMNRESQGLVGQLERHNQEFRQIFGSDLGSKLSGISSNLSELSRDFSRVGESMVHLPNALETINQTQAEYKHLLAGRFEELKRFNEEFGHHLKVHASETIAFEKNLKDATAIFEQVGVKNNQLINEMNETISQMKNSFHQRENQLESSVGILKDTLSRYVANLEGALGDKLDKVARSIQEYMELTNQGMKKEFKEIRSINEEIQQSSSRYTQQTFNELNQEIQKLNQQLYSFGQETRRLNDGIRLGQND